MFGRSIGRLFGGYIRLLSYIFTYNIEIHLFTLRKESLAGATFSFRAYFSLSSLLGWLDSENARNSFTFLLDPVRIFWATLAIPFWNDEH